jgi:hypothetical protein
MEGEEIVEVNMFFGFSILICKRKMKQERYREEEKMVIEIYLVE